MVINGFPVFVFSGGWFLLFFKQVMLQDKQDSAVSEFNARRVPRRHDHFAALHSSVLADKILDGIFKCSW
jgi:hypothetical protein